MKNQKAFGYVRGATNRADGSGSTIIQAKAIRAHALAHGIDIVRMFEEPDLPQPGLARMKFDVMIATATAGDRPVDLVLVYSLSRFARHVTTQVAAERDLAAAGVRLVVVAESLGS